MIKQVGKEKTIIKVLLFFLAGIPGLLLLFVSSVGLFGAYYDPNAHQSSPVICGLVGIMVLGSLLILVGVGKWRRWRYLVVFLAMPLVLFTEILLFPCLPSFLTGKFMPVLFMGSASFLVFHLVRHSYRKEN